MANGFAFWALVRLSSSKADLTTENDIIRYNRNEKQYVSNLPFSPWSSNLGSQSLAVEEREEGGGIAAESVTFRGVHACQYTCTFMQFVPITWLFEMYCALATTCTCRHIQWNPSNPDTLGTNTNGYYIYMYVHAFIKTCHSQEHLTTCNVCCSCHAVLQFLRTHPISKTIRYHISFNNLARKQQYCLSFTEFLEVNIQQSIRMHILYSHL